MSTHRPGYPLRVGGVAAATLMTLGIKRLNRPIPTLQSDPNHHHERHVP
jgi:hypothetical protein